MSTCLVACLRGITISLDFGVFSNSEHFEYLMKADIFNYSRLIYTI